MMPTSPNRPRRSRHVLDRAAQRGVHIEDLDLIRLYGTEINGGNILLEHDRRKLIQRLDHLLGLAVFEKAGVITTTFRPTKRQQRVLKNGEKITRPRMQRQHDRTR